MVGRVFLGRYEAIRLLGEGGMGRVYLAHRPTLDAKWSSRSCTITSPPIPNFANASRAKC